MITKASWTIAKKELKGYVDKPTAYILLVVFAAVSLFLFFRSALLVGEASMRPLFNVLPWIMLFFVPPITMRLFAEEEKAGTMELLLTQPISDMDVLVGKLLGAFFFVCLALATTLPAALTMRFGGAMDYGVVFAQYFGAVMLAAIFVSIGIFASALTKNQVVASIIAITINFVLVILGFDVVLLAAPPAIGAIMQLVSPLTHFENIGRGVIDLRDVIYFASVVIAFGALAYLMLKSKRISRSTPNYYNLQVGIAIIVGICIGVNVLSGYVGGRLDLTESKLFTLSPATVKTLREVPDVVTVKLYASQDLPGELALTFRDTKDLLGDYGSASGGKVQVQTLYPGATSDVSQANPTGGDKIAQEAQAAGVQPVQFNVMSADKLQMERGYLGIAVSYAGKKEAIPFVQRTDDLEYQLTSLVRKLTIKDRKTVAFLTGHGEKTKAKDFTTLDTEMQKQYETKEVSSKGKAGLNLSGVDTLIIAGPSQKIAPADRAKITAFLDGGGHVFFMLDTVTINPQFGFGMANPNSFADFVEKLGVRINADMVYDLGANETVTFPSGQGFNVSVPYPLWLRATSASTAVGGNIRSILVPWASSVETTRGVRAIDVLRTSKDAGSQTGQFNIAPDQNFPKTSLKTRLLAAARSDVGASKRGRIVVIGDADYATEQFAKNAPENISYTLNAIDWLAQQESLAGIRSKRSQPHELAFSSQTMQQLVKWGNMAGVPIVIALIGFWYLLRRRRISREGGPS